MFRKPANRRPTRRESDEPVRGGRITDIASQTHDPERVSVFIDGAFAFGIAAAQSVAEGLRIGDDVSDDDVTRLLALDEVGRATEASLRLLTLRPRSTREIRDRLRQRGFAPESIDAALEKLAGWRYVDDAEFARFWVENRESHKPRGRRLLEQELRHKGVDREVVRDAIDTAELDEEAAALTLARAKLRSYAGLEPLVVRRRLGGYLARRGYAGNVVRPVLDRVLNEPSDPDGDLYDDPDVGPET